MCVCVCGGGGYAVLSNWVGLFFFYCCFPFYDVPDLFCFLLCPASSLWWWPASPFGGAGIVSACSSLGLLEGALLLGGGAIVLVLCRGMRGGGVAAF